jgi:hypothetical protein
MPSNNSRPSETSPLLPKPDDNVQSSDSINVFPNTGEHAPDTNEEDGGDIERQPSNSSTSKHQGLPEVRKRLKYIFPAIAIGVSLPFHPKNTYVYT